MDERLTKQGEPAGQQHEPAPDANPAPTLANLAKRLGQVEGDIDAYELAGMDALPQLPEFERVRDGMGEFFTYARLIVASLRRLAEEFDRAEILLNASETRTHPLVDPDLAGQNAVWRECQTAFSFPGKDLRR